MKQRRTSARKCANVVIPDGLTEQFREKILALPESVKTDYLKSEVFSKFVSSDTEPAEVRRNRAIFKWLCTEENNRSTNERFLLVDNDYNVLPHVPLNEFLEFCRDLIAKIIGDTVPIEALIGSFSGGASTSRNRTESHPAHKFVGKAHVTQRCLDTFLLIAEEVPGWLRAQVPFSVEIVPGNVMFTVPKDTGIDRVACKEPDVNMFLQKGIGDWIRSNLRSRANINLNDQSINRSLARKGSVEGKLATLDLSSASDSISTGVVAELLPVCWYTLLDSVRSQVTVIDGEEHLNEMFSSMGNGFTFELESLLFYTLVRAVCYFRGHPGIVSVYGDDLIVPAAAAADITEVFEFFGFQVNTKKSYSEGPFRESCGGHYYDGLDITPFYVKGELKVLTDVIHAANQLRQWAHVHDGLGVLDPRVEDIWIWLASYIPSYLRGGVDTSNKYQLVSNDEPAYRLQEETKRRGTGMGGYILWLNASRNREVAGDGFQTSSSTHGQGRYRLRPALKSTVTKVSGLFLHEIFQTSDNAGV